MQVAANSDSVNYLTSSQGGLLNSQRIQDLPVSGRNAMELVGNAGRHGDSTSSGVNMNGARTDMMDITLDGTNIQDNAVLESITGQMISTTVDRVEEVRVVTSPADAEYGRGSGQVQLVSRSGTNKFHGSAYDFAHNTDLNANTWANNRSGIARSVQVLEPGRRTRGWADPQEQDLLLRAVRDQHQPHADPVTDTVLTSQARQGIFRFSPGVQNGNANANNPSVDLSGNPVSPRGATGPCKRSACSGSTPTAWRPTRPASSPRIWP